MINNRVEHHHHSSGISLGSLLTTLFVGLKLSGHITWGWVWVLSPIWITILVAILILSIAAVVALVSR